MSLTEELDAIKKRLEANLEEMKRLYEDYLAMRELCSYELQNIKK